MFVKTTPLLLDLPQTTKPKLVIYPPQDSNQLTNGYAR